MVTHASTMPASSPDAHVGIVIEGGPLHAIADEHRALLAPATHVLHEWHTYKVYCRGATRLEIGSQSFDAIVESVFQIRYENQVGHSRIRAFDATGTPLDTRNVEVVSPKLGDVATSLAFLKAMLADLTTEESAIAFLPRSSTSRTVRTIHRPPSLLVQFFYLLNNAEAIADALSFILRSPHRVLDDESQHVSIFDLTEVDADVVLQLVQGDAAWDRATTPPRLKAAPGGVWFRVPQEGFDSAENRFVRAVSVSMADACEDVLRASWLQGNTDPGAQRRREALSRLHGQMRQFERAPMFDDVGPLHRIPALSRVLQRRAGYRDLNLHWQAFLTAREPVWQRMQHAIDLRDIATLYEYWIWFALCREIREIHGEAPVVDALTPSEPGLPHGLKATFKGLGTLTYNASRRAYSGITLRPDYLWEPVEGRKVAFDAKFRLAWDAAPLDVPEREAASDPVAKAKADDLVKMHAYRDAITGLRAAVVLFPGNVARFRTSAKKAIDQVTVRDVLCGELEGVGAIPMNSVGWSDE